MMGPRQVDQAPLFYEFSLERHVPAAHLLGAIDRFVDLSDVRSHLAPLYSSTGRPSIDPELLVRMLLVGYCYGIRSERRLCEEVHLNLAYRWFCRLGLDGEVPDQGGSLVRTRTFRFVTHEFPVLWPHVYLGMWSSGRSRLRSGVSNLDRLGAFDPGSRETRLQNGGIGWAFLSRTPPARRSISDHGRGYVKQLAQ
jgi:transposase